MSDSKTKEHTAIAAEAEGVVVSVKGPELRRVAFEKILATLLGHKTTGTTFGGSRTKSGGKRKLDSKRAPDRPARKPKKGPKAYVEDLIDEDFFKKQRTIVNMKGELPNRGQHIALTSLSSPLLALTQDRRLRRQKAAANSKGTKTTYAYSHS